MNSKNFSEKPDYLSVRCALQRALLGTITPNIREITVTFNHEEIEIYYYFNSQPSEDEIEESEIVVTEVICSFLDVAVHIHRFVIPEPEFIPKNDTICVYKRWEKPIPE